MTSEESAGQGALQDGTVLVAAFEGWNDAGSAASAAVLHLIEAWDAAKVDELDPEDYHDFQVNRPMSEFDAEGNLSITWPSTTVYVATEPLTGRRIVLVHGTEPSIRWRSFCAEVLDLARQLEVTTILTIGALLADVPHTRPIPVTSTSADSGLQELLDIRPSSYEGPTGIVGILQHQAHENGFPGVSLWAAVPHYVAHPPSPKATLAILTRLEEMLAVTVPMGDLIESSRAWQQGVDELAGEDSEISEYVTQLEEAKDTADLPEASGDAIAKEFEKYLRRRDNGSQP